jgi:hypothetical protein
MYIYIIYFTIIALLVKSDGIKFSSSAIGTSFKSEDAKRVKDCETLIIIDTSSYVRYINGHVSFTMRLLWLPDTWRPLATF